MAKQQQLNGLGSNGEMKELVKLMGKMIALCRMIFSVFAVYAHGIFSGSEMNTLVVMEIVELIMNKTN